MLHSDAPCTPATQLLVYKCTTADCEYRHSWHTTARINGHTVIVNRFSAVAPNSINTNTF
jgi:hypothetical protein